MVINEFNRVQINLTEDRDAAGKLLKQGLMINIRTNETEEAVRLYKDLRKQLSDQNEPASPEHAPEQHKEDCTPICPSHSVPMRIRENRSKGTRFWGCEHWKLGGRGCNMTLPIEVSREGQVQSKELQSVSY